MSKKELFEVANKKKFKRVKFRTKLYIISLALIILPIAIVGTVVASALIRQAEADKGAMQSRDVDKIVTQISEVFTTAEKLCDIIYYNTDLSKALLGEKPAEVGKAYVDLIYPLFRQNKSMQPFVSEFCIYINNEKFMANGKEVRQITDSEEIATWYKFLTSSQGDTYTDIAENHISFYKKNNFYLSSISGYMRIDIDKNYLLHNILGEPTDYNYIITNSRGVLLTNNIDLSEKVVNKKAIKEDYLTTTKRLENTVIAGEASVTCYLNRKIALKQIYVQNAFLIGGLICVVVLMVIVFAVLVGRPLSGINSLSVSAEMVVRGDFTVKVPIKSEDEIGILCKNYNYMLDYLNNLINESYRKEIALQKNMIQQQKTELKALQEQINPHFLYNTLDAIRMQAVLNDDNEVSEMLVLLAKLFKYNVGFASEEVTLKDEIEHLNNYLTLINIRKGSHYKLINNIENSDKINILRFTIQPIVENSIKYAFCGKSEGEITISSEIEMDTRVLSVTDNGVGIKQEKIDEINNSLQSEVTGDSNIGLKNVYSRLVLKYGGEYGLNVQKTAVGAKVNVFIPYKSV